MDKLRQYMEDSFQGLQETRSTESYALEFLKTATANGTFWAEQAIRANQELPAWFSGYADPVL